MRSGQRGQAAVEVVGVAFALAIVAFVGWQAITAASVWQTAQSAARSGARAGLVGSQVQRAALTVLPDRLAERARVGRGPGGAVRVTVPVPWLLPGRWPAGVTGEAGAWP